MNINYQSGSYRINSFKMNLTEAIRAHANHECDVAEKHYGSASQGAQNGHSDLRYLLVFLESQAASNRTGWDFASALKHAKQAGYEEELATLANLIEDQSVRNVYEHYLEAILHGERPITRRLQRGAFVDPTPTSRTKRPR